MNNMLKRLFAIMSVLMTLSIAPPVYASGGPSDSLHYILDHDTAFVEGTRDTDSSSLEIATLAFKWKWDGTATNINTISMQFKFDTTELSFVEARVDTANWSHNFYVDAITYANDTATVTLKWDGGSETVPSDTTTYCYIDFTLGCQAELNSNDVQFTSSSANETNIDGLLKSPASGNYSNGAVTSGDYDALYWIPDVTVTGNSGDRINVPLLGTKNYYTEIVQPVISFDTTRLSLKLITINQADSFFVMISSVSGADSTIVWLIANAPGLQNEFDNDTLMVMEFEVLCDAPDFNQSTAITLRGSSHDTVLSCSGITDYEFSSSTGSIAFDNSVVISASQDVGAGVGNMVGKSTSDSVSYTVEMLNTLAVGNVSVGGPNQDAGIQFGINFGNDGFQLNSTAATSLVSGVSFAGDDGNGDEGLVYQTNSTTDYLPAVASSTNIMKVYFDWNSSDFTPTSWSDRYFVPQLKHSASTPSMHYAEVPDTSDCLVADSASNGLLTFVQPTDSIEVYLGEYSTNGYTSQTSCSYTDIYVRANFDTDSCSFKVRVGSGICITGTTDKLTGVTASQISDTLWEIHTTSLFSTLGAADTVVKLIRVNTGIKGTCLVNKTLGVGLTIEGQLIWNDAGAQQYAVTAQGSSAQAKCVNGNGCFACGFGGGGGGDPPPRLDKATDESALPEVFALHQNFPNPFNPVTKIKLDLPEQSSWTITVFNVMGQKVKEFTGESSPGTVTVEWDARDSASGMYFYKVVAGDFQATKKMILLK